MIDPDQIPELRQQMRQRAEADARVLNALRERIQGLRAAVHPILPRSATTMSVVASDGGNNKIQFDPFLLQVVRVVDSYGEQLCLDVVSPNADMDELSERQFAAGRPATALGHMMEALDKRHLSEISPMLRRARPEQDPAATRPDWVLTYRDLCEWAVLHERLCRSQFSTDTLIVRDGLLRSKIFAGDLFTTLCGLFREGIERARRARRRKLYLVGIAKHNAVITRYRLAMALEGIMTGAYPCYVQIPYEVEETAYVWREWARREGVTGGIGEAAKFTAGVLYLVRFGRSPQDPIWAVDVLEGQQQDDTVILGHLLADALDGFPVPVFPRSLQQAHERAAIVDFDMDIVEAEAYRAIRGILPPDRADLLDALRLQGDPSAARYQ